MTAMIVLVIAVMFRPFLPGAYDGLAVTLSRVSQILGALGLLLVPIGALWLVFKNNGYYFGTAAVVVSSMIAAIASLAAFSESGFSLGLGFVALAAYGLSRVMPQLKRLKQLEGRTANPTALYLLVVPSVVALVQFSLLGSAVEFSRRHAIRQSAALINDIEQYHKATGRYPTSLLAVWPDYKPSVIGIERYHYEPSGDAYNLYFEQLSDRVGTREFVMYNKRDEHLMVSHTVDILSRRLDQLRGRGGYYAVHDASSPHWKYFWFD
jgi:hypothetical protein